ncbi:unnamed protein product [Arabis nemorensis]|uniref:Uncharacterized protein n=1 Tax=Arabis nemorensis TaxID=586526 RepID=A0A565BLL7_9BRAS|nr:unnamed protein product [Arabis nemorensis]
MIRHEETGHRAGAASVERIDEESLVSMRGLRSSRDIPLVIVERLLLTLTRLLPPCFLRSLFPALAFLLPIPSRAKGATPRWLVTESRLEDYFAKLRAFEKQEANMEHVIHKARCEMTTKFQETLTCIESSSMSLSGLERGVSTLLRSRVTYSSSNRFGVRLLRILRPRRKILSRRCLRRKEPIRCLQTRWQTLGGFFAPSWLGWMTVSVSS